MNCPACAAPLTTLNLQGLAVEVCRSGCGGIWFDNFELSRVDEAHEELGAALAEMEFNPDTVVLREKRPCPKCAGITMLQHKFSREKPVVVDECPSCGGVWLDGGELSQIRTPTETREDRAKATQTFINSLVATELAQLRKRRAGGSQE